MSFLKNIDAAIKNAAQSEPGKAVTDQQTDAAIKQAADGNAKVEKIAKDLVAAGRLHGHGFILELRKEAAAAMNKAADNGMDGGKVTGSKVTEPGSVSDKTNALPTNKDNPSKGDIDESKSVKHLTEADIKTPGKTEKAESLVNAVSK